MLPLYEAKMLHLYDTRWATYEPDGSTRLMTEDEKAQREAPMPRYWVAESEVDAKLTGDWNQRGFLGWRDICRATDIRTVITTLGPRVAYGHKWLLALTDGEEHSLQAVWSAFVFDFSARQKVGGTSMTYFTLKQLPTLSPGQFQSSRFGLDRVTSDWVSLRVDRLNGWIPDQTERAQVRAELDGLMFHLYGLDRDEVSYVMDTFPIVKRKDEAEFGSYRTKDLVLQVYDALELAKQSGDPYRPPWHQEVPNDRNR